MNLKYGYKETYKYDLDRERMDQLTSSTNRSNTQTQFLFQLVDGNYEKLVELEKKMKALSCSYCPDTKEELDNIMNTHIERKCKHLETGATGITKSELKGTDKFPDQWGIYWLTGANHGSFGSHYYWNDKTKILIEK
jgi:hypothetical protein